MARGNSYLQGATFTPCKCVRQTPIHQRELPDSARMASHCLVWKRQVECYDSPATGDPAMRLGPLTQ